MELRRLASFSAAPNNCSLKGTEEVIPLNWKQGMMKYIFFLCYGSNMGPLSWGEVNILIRPKKSFISSLVILWVMLTCACTQSQYFLTFIDCLKSGIFLDSAVTLHFFYEWIFFFNTLAYHMSLWFLNHLSHAPMQCISMFSNNDENKWKYNQIQ